MIFSKLPFPDHINVSCKSPLTIPVLKERSSSYLYANYSHYDFNLLKVNSFCWVSSKLIRYNYKITLEDKCSLEARRYFLSYHDKNMLVDLKIFKPDQ
jgi:hypothetical protein